MATTTDDVFQAAFDLSTDDRRELIDRLLETFPCDDRDEVEATWKAEIRRRLQAIDEGTEELIPAKEVFAAIRERRAAQ